jgi:hypothetical protein
MALFGARIVVGRGPGSGEGHAVHAARLHIRELCVFLAACLIQDSGVEDGSASLLGIGHGGSPVTSAREGTGW